MPTSWEKRMPGGWQNDFTIVLRSGQRILLSSFVVVVSSVVPVSLLVFVFDHPCRFHNIHRNAAGPCHHPPITDCMIDSGLRSMTNVESWGLLGGVGQLAIQWIKKHPRHNSTRMARDACMCKIGMGGWVGGWVGGWSSSN